MPLWLPVHVLEAISIVTVHNWVETHCKRCPISFFIPAVWKSIFRNRSSHFLIQRQMSITWLDSHSPLLRPYLSYFLPLTSDSSRAALCQTFSKFSTRPPETHSCSHAKNTTQKHPSSQCSPPSCAPLKRKKGSFESWMRSKKALTWFTGKCLGRVVTEDDRHSVLFCLPRHPGNVLDVMELSDLKKGESGSNTLPWMNTASSRRSSSSSSSKP